MRITIICVREMYEIHRYKRFLSEVIEDDIFGYKFKLHQSESTVGAMENYSEWGKLLKNTITLIHFFPRVLENFF